MVCALTTPLQRSLKYSVHPASSPPSRKLSSVRPVSSHLFLLLSSLSTLYAYPTCSNFLLDSSLTLSDAPGGILSGWYLSASLR